MSTIFQKIINREIPATIEFENDQLIVIRDIQPQAPIHLLIIPKKNIPTVNDISPEDTQLLFDMMQTAKAMATKFGYSEKGYRLVVNCNEYGGQTVFQLHMHLLAGTKFQGGFA